MHVRGASSIGCSVRVFCATVGCVALTVLLLAVLWSLDATHSIAVPDPDLRMCTTARTHAPSCATAVQAALDSNTGVVCTRSYGLSCRPTPHPLTLGICGRDSNARSRGHDRTRTAERTPAPRAFVVFKTARSGSSWLARLAKALIRRAASSEAASVHSNVTDLEASWTEVHAAASRAHTRAGTSEPQGRIGRVYFEPLCFEGCYGAATAAEEEELLRTLLHSTECPDVYKTMERVLEAGAEGNQTVARTVAQCVGHPALRQFAQAAASTRTAPFDWLHHGRTRGNAALKAACKPRASMHVHVGRAVSADTAPAVSNYSDAASGWIKHAGRSCHAYANGDYGVRTLTHSVEACQRNAACAAIVCLPMSTVYCTLRERPALTEYPGEDCYLPPALSRPEHRRTEAPHDAQQGQEQGTQANAPIIGLFVNPRFMDRVRWGRVLPSAASVAAIVNLRRTNLVSMAYSKFKHGGCAVHAKKKRVGSDRWARASGAMHAQGFATFSSVLLDCVQAYAIDDQEVCSS